ncbi:MAG: hypothetical protein ACJ78Q_21045 [Chloroflexia bacterium]
MLRARDSSRQALRPHFWVGVGLLAVGNFLIFARAPGGDFLRPYSDYWFACVWFGYIFAVDALVYQRDRRSLFVSARPVFLAMLPLSAAAWWGFEWLNERMQNWHYLRPYDIPEWYANFISCVFFSTVIPAVWETADWLRGTQWARNLPELRAITYPRFVPYLLIAAGIASFVLPLVWPRYFFGLIWGFAALVLDPINYLAGRPSIIGFVERGKWRVPIAFYLAGLTCGVLWEFWNFWAFPKWYYTVPYVGFLKVFEMPVLGYLGYGPFALELFAVFWFFAGLLPRHRNLGGLVPLKMGLEE